MIRSLLIGAVAGTRAMTPLAMVASAAARGELPAGNGAPAALGHPLVAAGTLALAAGELAGDKMPSAPDRIVAAGIAGRLVTGVVAAMALAPRRNRVAAGALGAAAAVLSAHLTWRLRVRALRRYGQVPTGFVEDAATLAAAALVVRGARPA